MPLFTRSMGKGSFGSLLLRRDWLKYGVSSFLFVLFRLIFLLSLSLSMWTVAGLGVVSGLFVCWVLKISS